jgi:ketosteroid isomerase-like protein
MEGSTPPSDTAWAMSEENVEIVRRVYEIIADGFNEETVRAAIANGLVNPDAELDLRTAYSDGPVVRLATLSEFLDTQPWGRSTRLEPESFRAVGTERVLVFLRLRGIGTGSGVEVEAPIAHLLTLRDRQVVRLESYIDRGKALEAAGLREYGRSQPPRCQSAS